MSQSARPCLLVAFAFVAGAIGVGFLLVGDRIPDKAMAATQPTPPLGDPLPEAA